MEEDSGLVVREILNLRDASYAWVGEEDGVVADFWGLVALLLMKGKIFKQKEAG